jgi:hypothetical protein
MRVTGCQDQGSNSKRIVGTAKGEPLTPSFEGSWMLVEKLRLDQMCLIHLELSREDGCRSRGI